ncbi:SIS domain-containing protein [Actinopolymorpha sp. B17G11]|uniref:SIS domain-containing protein n=1 Tax=unclassified Actinopolymorpha TaxID=2627063 RepID=UPI0032D992A3
MPFVTDEIASQPDCWRQAVMLADKTGTMLPRPGERVAILGCGTSLFIGQSYAALREAAGHGETDAYAATEFPQGRRYDRVVALSRSGTTTEVLSQLTRLRGNVPTVALTADPVAPMVDLADETVVLNFAEEHAVVQTRFATSALTLLRAHLGIDLEGAIADAETTVAAPLPAGAVERRQFTFLGTGWTIGLANEAALKMREASLSWTEAYPAMEYRHGPISITDTSSVVWFLGAPPAGLVEEIRKLGALVVSEPQSDPVAELIRIQRLAVEIGAAKSLDPDRPRNLSFSVVLSPASGAGIS